MKQVRNENKRDVGGIERRRNSESNERIEGKRSGRRRMRKQRER